MTDVSSATKFWPTAKEGFTTATSGSVSSGAATVGLNSVTGYSNGDVVCLVIDPTDTSKKQVFTGTVDTSGLQITGVVWTEGTNQAHSSGATVVDYETASAWALQAKGFLVEHSQAGTHGAITATSATVSGAATVAGLLTASAGLTASGTFTLAGIGDGWLGANETLTYGSATTFTCSAGLAAVLAVGDKIKLTQTTVKYFYVTGISGTTITVTGGSDYTLANAAITLPFYSHQETPAGFPQWFNYTPSSIVGFSANPTAIYRFSVRGRECLVVSRASGVGTSNSTSYTVSAPIASANPGTMSWIGTGVSLNNGVALTDRTTEPHIENNSSTITVAIGPNNDTGWTSSGNKYANFQLSYEI